MKRQQSLTLIVLALAVLGAALIAWYAFRAPPETPAGATASKPDEAKKERKVLYWTDPMVPGYRSDKPGKSPFMDMELVPVYDDAHGSASVAGGATPGTEEVEPRQEQRPRMPGATDEAGASVVTIRPEIVQNLGVRTYKVTRATPPRRVHATGYLFRDARGMAVLVDLVGREAGLVRTGQLAEVRVPDVSERTHRGNVESVESDIDIGGRALKARVRLARADTALKPNMPAEVAIQAAAIGRAGLFIPREALIRTGYRNAVVLRLSEGRFQPVEVEPGAEADDWVEIRRGIKEGDTVVTSGQFLIDSEANVRASFARMQPETPEGAAAPAGTDGGAP
jgi:hypothetical protein